MTVKSSAQAFRLHGTLKENGTDRHHLFLRLWLPPALNFERSYAHVGALAVAYLKKLAEAQSAPSQRTAERNPAYPRRCRQRAILQAPLTAVKSRLRGYFA